MSDPTRNQDPFDSLEWKNVLSVAFTRGGTVCFTKQSQFIINFVRKFYPVINFRMVEEKLREIGSFVYLFAEDPLVANYWRGCIPMLPLPNSQIIEMKYLFSMSNKNLPRELMAEDFEIGCRDPNINLKRLEETGIFCSDSGTRTGLISFLRMGKHQDSGQLTPANKMFFKKLIKLINEDDEAMNIWKEAKIPITFNNKILYPGQKKIHRC